MNARRGNLPLVLGVGLIIGCPELPRVDATVEIEIEGQRHSFQTRRAQVEDRSDPGRYSVYLVPSEGADELPVVSLRTYSGNPVRHLRLRFRPSGAEADSDPLRYECFIPGKLRDGRDTLTWTQADGSARDKTESGERDCRVDLKVDGDRLRFEFEARMRPVRASKKKGKAKVDALPDASAGVLPIKGHAVIELR